jgi:23S rRNA pseudouridine2605 synthase
MVYLLLNKPKNHITTAKDPEGRLTVMDLVRDATPYRLFPVGRLDRNTTGILLFTNDGELAKKLTHPSYNIRKLYYVRLDRPFSKVDMEKIKKGILLDDGPAKADRIDYVEGGAKSEIGVEIHSGRNRLVRRMFEHLGYRIIALDRVAFGPIDRKGVPRGKWRFLTPLEIGLLKMMH